MERLAVEDPTGRLADEWEELAEQAGASPFLRPGWFAAWWDAFGRGRREVLALRDGGTLLAVMPCAVRGPVRSAQVNWHTPELAILARDAGAAARMAEALVRRNRGMLDLLFLEAGGVSSRALARAAETARQWTLVRSAELSPYVDTTGDAQAWEDALDHHLRTELRRRRRRLEERGPVEVTVTDGTQRLDTLLDEGFAVEAAGWKGAAGTAIRADPATRRFYHDVAHWAAARGWLRLAFLRCDGAAVAFDYCIEQGGVHHLLKTGYDPSYAPCSPGRLLRHAMIRRAFAEGLRSYEFLGRDEAWKLEWNVRCRDRLRLQVFARTPAGAALWWAYTYGRPLLRRVRPGVTAPAASP